ncbi:MAG TPA: hydroxysqualene dehydroxylase HpnE [Burkholderiaceae bacterium]|nr:hydroxysqualene dehydroxylase HpnE [Burkholderiaceae bacterium]
MEDLGRVVTTRLKVGVIGGGWAGCAAAAACARAGHEPILLEAGSELGGRARRLVLELDGARHTLDNGQHLLVGAYTAVAGLLAQCGVALDSVFVRKPFEISYPDGLRVRAARLPAPWHLVSAVLTARGLGWADRVALARLLPQLKAQGWTVAPDRAAGPWLRQQRQTPRLIDRLWRPLTLASLNTPLDEASAQALAAVLRDSLGATAEASEMWLPRSDLSAVLPEAVERLIRDGGGEVRRNHRVDLARASERGWTLAIRAGGDHKSLDVDALVYAAPAAQLQRVFGLHTDALRQPLRMIERFRYEPITTIYLKYVQEEPRLPALLNALVDNVVSGHHGQWVFNRGALDTGNRGVLGVVISSGGIDEEPTLDALCAAVARQMSEVYGLPPPRAARAIIERRATLACVPDLERPPQSTALPRLALAGDWTASEYPCTLETAVRSGTAAAAWATSPASR